MKKNVLFVLTDDQRFNTIHTLGNPDVITPTMDWLVENGTAFTQAHIPVVPVVQCVCQPRYAQYWAYSVSSRGRRADYTIGAYHVGGDVQRSRVQMFRYW